MKRLMVVLLSLTIFTGCASQKYVDSISYDIIKELNHNRQIIDALKERTELQEQRSVELLEYLEKNGNDMTDMEKNLINIIYSMVDMLRENNTTTMSDINPKFDVLSWYYNIYNNLGADNDE